jgi:hypothetical protein
MVGLRALFCVGAIVLGLVVAPRVRAEESQSEKEPDKIDWLVLQPSIGYRSLHVRKVEFDRDDPTPKLIPGSTQAVAPGLGVGVRLWFVSLMLRPEVAFFQGTRGDAFDNSFRLWSFDLELLFRAPLGRFQPYLLLGGGYSAMGALAEVVDGRRREALARGGNVRAGIGFDVFLAQAWMVGLRATIDGIFLSSKVPVSELLTPEQVDTVGQAEHRARDADGFMSGLSPSLALTFGVRL